MSLGLSTVARAAYRTDSVRLDRVIQATLRRNIDRRANGFGLPWETFAPQQVPSSTSQSSALRDAFSFYIEQMYFTEAASPENLAALAASSPVAQVQQAFAAQIQDEIAHGQMLQRYVVDKLGYSDPREHWVSYVGRKSGKVMQAMHPAVGARAVTMAIEYYASSLAEALLEKVDEPLLRAILQDIQKDENRHRVLAVESAALLQTAGVGQSFVGRATAALLLPAAEAWFRHVMNGALRSHCAVMGIPFGDLYEKAVEHMRLDLQQALSSTSITPPAETPTALPS